jgi:Fibronectin type III domain
MKRVLQPLRPLAVVVTAGVLLWMATPRGNAQSATTTSTVPPATTSTTTTTIPATTLVATTLPATTLPATTLPATTTSTTRPLAAPGVPKNVVANLTGTAQLTVTWEAPDSLGNPPAVQYRVIGVNIVGNTSTTLPTVTTSSLNAVFNDLRPGTYYSFYVRAENAAGSGPNTLYTSPVFVPAPVTTVPASPSPAVNVVLTSPGNGVLTVNWSPPPSTATAVVQYRISLVPSVGSSITVGAGQLSVSFAGAKAGTGYVGQVVAIGANGKTSLIATSAVIVTPPASTVPQTIPPVTNPPATNPGVTLKPLPGQAPTPPGKPRPCVSVKWPSWVSGRPQAFAAGAQQGVYLWHDGRYWQVRVYNPGPGAVVFTGTVTTNAKVTFYSSGLERGDILSRSRAQANFSFRSDYDIDGIRINASCATSTRFTFNLNGAPVPPNQIFIGSNNRAQVSDFTIVR